jgi:hypothetical protein
MSKSGRYSADRKKIEALTASKTVAVSDCGTIFTADSSGGAITVTLPSAASAGRGWWCKVIRVNGHVNDVTIGVNSDQCYGIEASGSSVEINGTTDIVLAGAVTGIQVEMISDGTNWLVLAHGRSAADVT